MKRNPSPNPGRGGKGGRDRQSVWCCGVNYSRWRFLDGNFPGTHHTHCLYCNQELVWPESKKARVEVQAKLRATARRAQRNVELRLTRHGAKRMKAVGLSELEQLWKAERAAMGEIALPDFNSSLKERHA